MRRQLPALPWLALITFLGLLLLVALLLMRDQWQHELATERRDTKLELQLLASLVHNDLQRGNYQHVDELIEEWGRNNTKIQSIRISAANGYPFSQYVRPTTAIHPIAFATNISYSYRGEARLELIKSFDRLYQRRDQFAWQLGSIYGVVALLLSALTYALLRYRYKSVALQHEVERRQQAEAALQHQHSQLEETVANRTAQLASSNRELEAFSYSVSHDLRAPLRAIDGFSMALLEDYGDRFDDTGRNYLNRVRSGAQKMGALIDDLLQLSRVTRTELQRQRIDLGQLAATIIEELRQGEPQRSVEVTIAANLWTYGDPILLQVLLTNLLGNAWKFTRKQPQAVIEFGILSQAGEKGFFIRDNGAGFDMRHAHKLFVAFQRLHGFEQYEGTGIGLATVQRVIAKHGGRIWAEAEINKGATFYFTLPIEDEVGDVTNDSNSSKP